MSDMIGPSHPGVRLAYGTAGFRAKAELLESTFFRMGALAVLRSRARGGLAVGLMVTASHNAEPDNGIKLIDADGGMLQQSWEAHCTELANASDEAFPATLDRLAAELLTGSSSAGSGGSPSSKRKLEPQGRVLVARDTRPHSERLANLALDGIRHLGGRGDDFGLLTTPQLHHIIRHVNGVDGSGPHVGPVEWASEEGYYQMLASAFAEMVTPEAAAKRAPLAVDAACGVGEPKLALLAAKLGRGLLPVSIGNKVGEGALNGECGAEYVQKGRKPPKGFTSATAPPFKGGADRACSLDGDADRLVYHYWRGGGGGKGGNGGYMADVYAETGGGEEWRLLDGDKIAALYALHVCEQLKALPASVQEELSMAVVQTAYANGSSGRYIRSLGLPTMLAKTGVKYVHHVAIQYDISIYFEANGHGTLLFSDKAVGALKKHAEQGAAAAKVLLSTRQLINQAIGDALSDLLLVEAILANKGWGVKEWDDLYEDLPSRQTKLPVKDRTALKVSEDETKALSPAVLQPALDELASKFDKGRCFVRPSGTEDVVRVYAEAATQEEADELAMLVAQATWKLAGGVGEMPTSAVV